MIMLPYVFLGRVRRQSEASTFIDLFELTNHIVVVAAKADQKCSYPRRKSKDADLSESVWLKVPFEKVRTVFCWLPSLPYSGLRSRYDEVVLVLGS